MFIAAADTQLSDEDTSITSTSSAAFIHTYRLYNLNSEPILILTFPAEHQPL